ncbi:hypothetical protein V8E54_009996 [Elaphomyces granulatus]
MMHPLIQRYTVPFLLATAPPALALHLAIKRYKKRCAISAGLSVLAAQQASFITNKYEALIAGCMADVRDLNDRLRAASNTE